MLEVDERAAMIDHAVIDADATGADMRAGIDVALKDRTAVLAGGAWAFSFCRQYGIRLSRGALAA